MEKTVFFGPFFGELGWEFAYWHGWVKKMCREKYQLYRKVVASYPGREPFYSDADEFWPHPLEITKLNISQRGYIADSWIGNLPKADSQKFIDRNISRYAESLLNKYKEKLPKDTIFYVPHKLNNYCLNNEKYLIGTLWPRGLSVYKRPKTFSVSLENQIFENLKPTEKGKDFFKKNIDSDQKFIAIFPRCRVSRRPDKSWPKEKYDLLIEYLQKKYPKHLIGILGAPGGCYYVDGVPPNCKDLINIPEGNRLDIHLAFLEKADIAIGSLSGAMRIAYASGCPSVEWGYPIELKNVNTYNCWAPFRDHKYIFWPEINPSVEKIQHLIDAIMNNREKEVIIPNSFQSQEFKKMSFVSIFQTILREIISKPFLWQLKRKRLPEGIIESWYLIQ